MALSEREQQMLDDMEQALSAEDPRFASQMNGRARMGEDRRRWVLGAVGALVGLGLVILGINWNMWIGVAGFAVIVAAVAYAATPRGGDTLGVVSDDGSVQPASGAGRKRSSPLRRSSRQPRPGRAPRQRGGGSFMERMEARWEQRRQGGDGRF